MHHVAIMEKEFQVVMQTVAQKQHLQSDIRSDSLCMKYMCAHRDWFTFEEQPLVKQYRAMF